MTSRRDSADPAASAASEPDSIGSYTTARVSAGRVERLERHVGRLRRDAARLGLPLPSRGKIEALFLSTAEQTFGRGDGVVRVEWSNAPGNVPELRAIPRDLGEDKRIWCARTAQTLHPGPGSRRNTKFVAVDAFELARGESREHRVDEVLLFDANGYLVEGAHSNCLVVDDAGRLVTPAKHLGGVEGLGLTIVRESHPEISETELCLSDLRAAREVMGVNAVRGVVPIIELDGKPIGSDAKTGPWAQRLRRIFFRD